MTALFFTFSAEAIEQQVGRNNFRLNGYGTYGSVSDNGNFYDFLIRGQASHLLSNRWNIGAVYALDRKAKDAGYAAKDAFLYAETEWGRVETGWTESIASKLALALPDVGGTRLNDAPFFLPDDFVGITSPVVKGNQYAFRISMATIPSRPWQIGIGRTMFAEDFDSSFDIGLRYRNPYGRTKSSLSVGASYIDRPHGMDADSYLPNVFADARYQGTIGANVQFGSLLWAATFKAVVDDDPVGFRSDGLQAGTGFSYEFLSWAASVNYIFSDVGVWGGKDWVAHTGVLSIRYKLDQFFNLWASAGGVWASELSENYFVSGGLGIKF